VSDLHLPAAGVYTLSVQAPAGMAAQIPARFRFTNEAGQGGSSPVGLALTGEVEDYLFSRGALAASVDVEAYATRGGVELTLHTVNESGVGDIVVFAWSGGAWVEVARIPASEVVGEGSNTYRARAEGLKEGEAYAIKVVDEEGRVHIPKHKIRVKAIRTKRLRVTEGQLELTFSTELGLRYQVLSCGSLGASQDGWAGEPVSVLTEEGWSPWSARPFMAGAGEETTVRIRRERGNAYYKIARVDDEL
jgi:hypothetical protein